MAEQMVEKIGLSGKTQGSELSSTLHITVSWRAFTAYFTKPCLLHLVSKIEDLFF